MASICQTHSLKNIKLFCSALEIISILIFEIWTIWLFYCFYSKTEPLYFLDSSNSLKQLSFLNISAFLLIFIGSVIVLRTWVSFYFCLKMCHRRLCYFFKHIFYFFILIYFLIGAFLPDFVSRFVADQSVFYNTRGLVLFTIIIFPIVFIIWIEKNFWDFFPNYVKIRMAFVITHLVFIATSPMFSFLFSFVALPLFIFIRE